MMFGWPKGLRLEVYKGYLKRCNLLRSDAVKDISALRGLECRSCLGKKI